MKIHKENHAMRYIKSYRDISRVLDNKNKNPSKILNWLYNKTVLVTL